MRYEQFIPPISGVVYRKIKSLFKKNKYIIGGFEIDTPKGYALQQHQQFHKLYDKFLPALSKFIDSNKTIIDIGANIGDTAYSILQQCKNPMICIEPSDVFFPYLQRNISKLPNEYSSRVTTYKNLIGTGLIHGELFHSIAGSAELLVNGKPGSVEPIQLDKLLFSKPLDVILLKVDTDGFDYDVIQSSPKILERDNPIIFWENYISNDFQYKGFEDMYSMLLNKGYKYLFIFDNFGNLILEEPDYKSLSQLNAYIYSQNKYNCTKTIGYTDVLAVTEKHIPLVREVISFYKTTAIVDSILH